MQLSLLNLWGVVNTMGKGRVFFLPLSLETPAHGPATFVCEACWSQIRFPAAFGYAVLSTLGPDGRQHPESALNSQTLDFNPGS